MKLQTVTTIAIIDIIKDAISINGKFLILANVQKMNKQLFKYWLRINGFRPELVRSGTD